MFGRVARRIPLHRTPKTQLKRSLSSNTVPNAVSTSPESPLPQELLELVSNEGFLRTFSNAFLHVPEYLPSVCDSYSVSIVLLVLALRAGFTLPVTLWQRRRSDRLQRVVVPKMEEWAKQARERLRHQCRKQGKSYEEYVEIYNEAVSASYSSLQRLCLNAFYLLDRSKSNKKPWRKNTNVSHGVPCLLHSWYICLCSC